MDLTALITRSQALGTPMKGCMPGRMQASPCPVSTQTGRLPSFHADAAFQDSPEPRNSWGRRWGSATSRLYGSLPFSLSSLTIVDL